MTMQQPVAGYPADSLSGRLCAILHANPQGLRARQLAALGCVAPDKLPRLLAVPLAAGTVCAEPARAGTLFRAREHADRPVLAPRKAGYDAADIQRVMDIVAAHPHGISAPSLAQEARVTRDQLDLIVRKLAHRGAIVRRGTRLEQTACGRRAMVLWCLAGQTAEDPPPPADDPAPQPLLADPPTQASRLRLLADNHLRGEEYAEVRAWLHTLSDALERLEVQP